MRVARTRLLRRPKRFFRNTSTRTSDILSSVPAYFGHISCCADFRLPVFLNFLLGRYPVGRICVARTQLLRRPEAFSRRKAFLEALSRIVRATLISRRRGHFICLILLDMASVGRNFAFCVSCCPLVCFGFGIKFPSADGYLTAGALSNSASNSRTGAPPTA